jgi:hypothetical protein
MPSFGSGSRSIRVHKESSSPMRRERKWGGRAWFLRRDMHESFLVIGRKDVLGAYNMEDITLTLPGGLTLRDIKWFGVWCRAYEVTLPPFPSRAVGESESKNKFSLGQLWRSLYPGGPGLPAAPRDRLPLGSACRELRTHRHHRLLHHPRPRFYVRRARARYVRPLMPRVEVRRKTSDHSDPFQPCSSGWGRGSQGQMV